MQQNHYIANIDLWFCEEKKIEEKCMANDQELANGSINFIKGKMEITYGARWWIDNTFNWNCFILCLHTHSTLQCALSALCLFSLIPFSLLNLPSMSIAKILHYPKQVFCIVLAFYCTPYHRHVYFLFTNFSFCHCATDERNGNYGKAHKTPACAQLNFNIENIETSCYRHTIVRKTYSTPPSMSYYPKK